MRKSLAEVWRRLQIPPEELAAWCVRRGVVKFSVYGSVLYRHFPADSDINVLLRFAPGRTPAPEGRGDLAAEVATLIGRPTTVLDEGQVDLDPSTFKRLSILATAQTLYHRRLAEEGSDTEAMEVMPHEEWSE